MKSAQHAQRVRHRLRIQHSVGENAFAQASDFAIFVESFQAAVYDLGYFQPDRVRTDVNRGECWHARVDVKSEKYQLLKPSFTRGLSHFGGSSKIQHTFTADS